MVLVTDYRTCVFYQILIVCIHETSYQPLKSKRKDRFGQIGQSWLLFIHLSLRRFHTKWARSSNKNIMLHFGVVENDPQDIHISWLFPERGKVVLIWKLGMAGEGEATGEILKSSTSRFFTRKTFLDEAQIHFSRHIQRAGYPLPQHQKMCFLSCDI